MRTSAGGHPTRDGRDTHTGRGHLSRILVSAGQRLERGQTIGLVGNSGRATGYHLHYEVELDGEAVNPLPYLLTETRSGS